MSLELLLAAVNRTLNAAAGVGVALVAALGLLEGL
jgi:hypothetical protein